MKLFVINLDRRPDRLERMTALFTRAGLEFERIRAVDGALLSVEELSVHRDSISARRGETACFLSHRSCWERIVESNLACAAIFEDDIHLGADVAALLNPRTWVPPEADVVKLETNRRPARIGKMALAAPGGRRLHRLHGFHPGAAGYIVTRHGAEKLLAASQKFSAPVDHFLFNPMAGAEKIAIFQLVPAICCQDFFLRDKTAIIGLGSDIHDERTTKLTASQKRIRELKRPFLKLYGLTRRKTSSILTDKRWMTIPLS